MGSQPTIEERNKSHTVNTNMKTIEDKEEKVTRQFTTVDIYDVIDNRLYHTDISKTRVYKRDGSVLDTDCRITDNLGSFSTFDCKSYDAMLKSMLEL